MHNPKYEIPLINNSSLYFSVFKYLANISVDKSANESFVEFDRYVNCFLNIPLNWALIILIELIKVISIIADEEMQSDPFLFSLKKKPIISIMSFICDKNADVKFKSNPVDRRGIVASCVDSFFNVSTCVDLFFNDTSFSIYIDSS